MLLHVKKSTPSVFISYSWENKAHCDWVRELAEKLEHNNVTVSLDIWDVAPGEYFSHYMERSAKNADYVLIICTPGYANKSDERRGGVGSELDIFSGQLASGTSRSKFIPLLRKGTTETGPNLGLPTLFSGVRYIDFRKNDKFKKSFEEVLRTIYGKPKYTRPKEGKPPSFEQTPNFDETPLKHSQFNTSFSHLQKCSPDELARSLEHFKKKIVEEPSNGDAYFNLGLCYLQIHLYDLAANNFKLAINHTPYKSDTYYYFGLSILRGIKWTHGSRQKPT